MPFPVLRARHCLLYHDVMQGGQSRGSLLFASSLCRCYTAQDAPGLRFCQDTLAAPAHPADPRSPSAALGCSWPSWQWPCIRLFYVKHKFHESIICNPGTSLETAGRAGSITGSHSTFLSPSSPAPPPTPAQSTGQDHQRGPPTPMSPEGKPVTDLRS